MTIPASWRKSSRSANGANCVEVDMSTRRKLRDSKNPGTVLTVSERAVDALLWFVR